MNRSIGIFSRWHRLPWGRLFWLLLVLVHVPVLIGAGRGLMAEPGPGRGLGVVALALTVAMFALKLWGVVFFPRSLGRARVLVFVLIAALVHHEAALTATDQIIAGPVGAMLVLVVAGESLRRSRRHLRVLRQRLATLLANRLNEHYLWRFADTLDRARGHLGRRLTLAAPRAPPA